MVHGSLTILIMAHYLTYLLTCMHSYSAAVEVRQEWDAIPLFIGKFNTIHFYLLLMLSNLPTYLLYSLYLYLYVVKLYRTLYKPSLWNCWTFLFYSTLKAVLLIKEFLWPGVVKKYKRNLKFHFAWFIFTLLILELKIPEMWM